MIDSIWTYIIIQLHLINFTIWIILFIISIVYDIFYTKSILYISQLNAIGAANLSVLLYIIMSYGIINFVQNPLNLIPLAVGAWVGTYGILKYEKIQREKQLKEKEKRKQKTEFINFIK